ncbi:hypothetical protein [Arthrobacter sp. TWP1-1]|uniref:hypothetical protein n=1 Tax=Arthrobacter sp. TWP1-1 TaxID=2804568 RepID=UPI003CF21728
MISELKETLGPLLPLKINRADSRYGELTFGGEGWTFGSPSAWRVVKDGVLVIGWSMVWREEDTPERVAELAGLSIVAVAPQSPRMGGDPAFELSDGSWVEIFSDHPIDPWAMDLPGLVYVGAPFDPRYVS